VIARCTAAVLLSLWIGGTAGYAQVRLAMPELPRRGSLELGGGLLWTGGVDLDSIPALLTSNDGNQAPPFTLFRTETRVGSVAGIQGRVGIFITPTVSLEGSVKYGRPIVTVQVSDDFEQAPALAVEQTMSRYMFDGSLLLHPRRWAMANRRGTPFVIVGAGYLRELHEGRELVETGRSYHAGAGVKYWLTHGRRRLGLRGDALVVIRDGAYGGDERRPHPALGATLSYLF
jgi:hypothetical protein